LPHEIEEKGVGIPLDGAIADEVPEIEVGSLKVRKLISARFQC
jgi:hypothetical protein